MNYLRNLSFAGNYKDYDVTLYLVLFLGTTFRLFHFFYNHSLWMDEVYLSTSLVKMNYKELLSQPLYYQQKAPVGFLILVKSILNIFGNKEIYLRIIPLISGTTAMFLFVPVAKHFLKRQGVYVAVSIFALSPALIFHSVEIKQYSTELLGSILSYLAFIHYNNPSNTKNLLKSRFIWGAIGAIIIWFSYSSIFILVGIAIGLSIQQLTLRKWRTFFLNAIPFIFWGLSFCINYFIFTHKHAESAWIAYWFRSYNNFMPLLPTSIAEFLWFPMNLYRMLDYPLGLLWNFNALSDNQAINMALKMPFIGITLLFLGLYAILKNLRANAFVLIPPIILMLIASGMELYPLTERFWVFISPIFIIFIAQGFQYLSRFIRSKRIILLIYLIIIAGPLIQSVQLALKPQSFYIHKKSFQKEALNYVNSQFKSGDIVYVYWNNLPGYKLYKEMYGYKFKAIEGKDYRQSSIDFNDYINHLKPDFKLLKNAKRVWVIYNKQFLTDIGDKLDDPAWYYNSEEIPPLHLIKEFGKYGKTKNAYESTDISVYLVEWN
ncbi:glycosyltransferase family 39 protein [Pedobacter sp. ASV1-7]|uniref:glycosyltransferase family 39 protein n=1 Tax=Pedobacter sp. ASV1-7 TaxID=3145237 RepID=UPI0032E88C85